MREIALWNSSAARKLGGTDGYLFHANVHRDDVLKAFVTELFRCVHMCVCVCVYVRVCVCAHAYACVRGIGLADVCPFGLSGVWLRSNTRDAN